MSAEQLKPHHQREMVNRIRDRIKAQNPTVPECLRELISHAVADELAALGNAGAVVVTDEMVSAVEGLEYTFGSGDEDFQGYVSAEMATEIYSKMHTVRPLTYADAPAVADFSDDALLGHFCNAIDNLNDMPISDEWAARWAKKAEVLIAPYMPGAQKQAPAVAAEPVEWQYRWRELVEQRLREWKSHSMNDDGDLLGLDDVMWSGGLDELIDYVCELPAAPAKTIVDCGEAGHDEGRCGNAHPPASPAGYPTVIGYDTSDERSAVICEYPDGRKIAYTKPEQGLLIYSEAGGHDEVPNSWQQTEKANMAKLDAIIASPADALDAARWIPVSERLPESSGYYLVCVSDPNYNFGHPVQRVCVFERTYYGVAVNRFKGTGTVLFWQPLPEPPDAAMAQGGEP